MDNNNDTTTTTNTTTIVTDPDTKAAGHQKTEDHPEAMSFDDMLKTNSAYQSEFDRRVAKALKTREEKTAQQVDDIAAIKDELTTYKLTDAISSTASVTPAQAKIISRLIDRSTVLSGTDVNTDALQTELDAIMDAFPALKGEGKKAEDKGKGSGFKIGSDGPADNNMNAESLHDEIFKAFGLK